MATIEIRMPGKDKPGYLRRQRESVQIQENLRANPTLENFDASIDWLLRTATEIIVSDDTDPREALLDLSEEEFDAVMEAARGGKPIVDPPNGG